MAYQNVLNYFSANLPDANEIMRSMEYLKKSDGGVTLSKLETYNHVEKLIDFCARYHALTQPNKKG